MKKQYTPSEQDANWKQYRRRKRLIPILVLVIAGLYFGIQEAQSYFKTKARIATKIEAMKTAITKADNHTYFSLLSRSQHVNLKVIDATSDSVNCVICNAIPNKTSHSYLSKQEIYTACTNSVATISLSKQDLLDAICLEKERNYCKALPAIHSSEIFTLQMGFQYSGIELEIRMGWKKSETESKTIQLTNKGIPVQIKEIIPIPGGQVQVLGKNLPTLIATGKSISLQVPIQKKLLPNSLNNPYYPYDFKIKMHTPIYGDQVYDVLFNHKNVFINESYLNQ